MKTNKKYFFGWTNIKHVIRQVYLTLTQQESELSSKKIERMMLFGTGLSGWIIWFCYHYKKLSVTDATIAVGLLFGYAGFTMVVTQKEKSKINQNETSNVN